MNNTILDNLNLNDQQKQAVQQLMNDWQNEVATLKKQLFVKTSQDKIKPNKQKLFEELERIAAIIPYPLYWTDANFVILGSNDTIIKAVGGSRDTIIGKSPHEFYKKEQAEAIIENCKKVIETKTVLYHGESIEDITTGEIKYFTGIRGPIFDEYDNVIGIIGTCIDITAQKNLEKIHNVFEELERVAAIIPYPLYWTDTNVVILGANDTIIHAVGGTRDAVIGKTPYEFYKKKQAKSIMENCKRVIKTKTVLYHDESIEDITTGKTKYFTGIRGPIFDMHGNVIGIIGTSVDVTAQKEAEFLKSEHEKHKIYVEEQEKFIKIVGQMAHDIRSPLSTLRTLAQTAEELSEQKRITLRRAVIGVEDITNHMLTRYKPQASALTENNQRQYVLVSVILSEIASERRYRYQDTLIEFEFIINKPQVDNFVFIQIEPSNLRRMLSNLINNAVESLPESGGKVMLILISSREWVEIIVEDNGKGISRQILDKIRQKNSITEGKAGGFGIGLTQVFDVVESNYGKFQIYSNDTMPDRGTIVRVRFPKATAQQWLATEIKITSNDTIIIVDDDISIHDAWDSRFARIVEKTPTIQIKHFMSGSEALLFINEIPDKQNFCLLSDYELVKQNLNGLEIIQESGIQRSILVTSHYANLEVKKLADQMAVKILPKDLVYSITIDIEQLQHKPGELVNVHMVIVDDEIESVKRLITDHYAHLIVDVYHNPFEFLKQVDKYPKNTKIIMDNKYYYNGNELIRDINGAIMASQLYVKGYTNLYIYSWEKCDTPEHVTLILKTDIETMAHLDEL